MAVRTLQECLDEFVSERPLQPDEYPDVVSGLPTVTLPLPTKDAADVVRKRENPPIVQMPDGRCCFCSERQHMLTMRPLDAHGKWQGKTQKEYLCRKADEERGFTAQEFYRQKRTAGKSSSSTGIQRACRRGLRPHRPPASRGGGAARSSRKRRNLGVKTRCVRVGTTRSNCWIGEKRGRMP